MSSPRPSLTSGGKRSNTCPKTHPRRAFSLFIPKRQCSTFHQESSMLASTNHQHTARGEVTFMEMRKMSGSRTQAKPPTDPQTEANLVLPNIRSGGRIEENPCGHIYSSDEKPESTTVKVSQSSMLVEGFVF
ncbi:uncharacterized protein LOC117812061 isoform X1 [Notolabrus celidotus]|uniref:uncharacterized protein LOC117812061 isoform X1 n=1 Tax=Notolabrus celidotus TaxID=1203425 RepID=UPI0014907B3A|nr:uncharacterized protein LOC117812061 isoform X1 [Notolabrus celidotus]XP_034538520.1 uncharacterized protein LOC117812061 isoform X1 [Notolabrus celidotus]XP_034538521.1 uncharacterized protein LOC117812061 isoform X1 [Notolabrus celidotus]